jgi:hypothetical protein
MTAQPAPTTTCQRCRKRPGQHCADPWMYQMTRATVSVVLCVTCYAARQGGEPLALVQEGTGGESRRG